MLYWTLNESYKGYVEEELEALAGLRPRLLEDLEKGGGRGGGVIVFCMGVSSRCSR